tara:strand:- start:404 stop:655 length:252 start_codon:yes stop_codon:yes gene_type:complete
MLVVKCRACNKEVTGNQSRMVSCGCENMTTIKGDIITAKDLSKVIILQNNSLETSRSSLSSEDIAWQENRRRRKVRKLDFEIR